MKPNFALTLSFEGIGLLHRTYAGWHLVGEVKLDVADLAADLAALAAKARALDPTGLRSKVVLPAEQIKYLDLETSDREVGAIDTQVRASLDGATPYALKELSYDWSVRDSTVYVAAVARETLAEAESFAVEHGFNPLCFVAMPEDDQFAGEPFFGETVHAGKVLGADESIDRENAVIRIVGTARMPEPEPAPETDLVFDAESDPVAEPEPTAEPEAAPDPEAKPEPAPAPAAAQGADSATGGKKRQAAPAKKAPVEKTESPAAPVAFTSIRRAKGTDATKAEDASARTPELPKARFSPPPMKAEPPAPDGPAKKAPGQAQEVELPADEAARLGASLRPMEEDGDADRPLLAERAEASSRASFLSRRKNLGGLASAGGRRKAQDKSAAAGEAEASAAAMAAAPPAAAATGAMDEKSRMTVFGARRMESDQGSDRPRYLALVLTAVLLLVLVAIAAWAALFLDDGISGLFRRSEDTRIVEQTAQDGAQAAMIQTPADTAGAETAETGTVIEAALPEEPETELAALSEPTNEDETGLPDRLPEVIPEELTPDEARARYAATGIWQMAPEPSTAPGTTTMRDVYQTNLDPDVNFSDAVALPEAEELRPEQRPQTPADPPPPSAQYDLDERGFIAATPEGTETPEGVTIFAGRPPVLPPSTPPRAEPKALDGPEAAAPDEPTLRPRLRPEDVTDAFERTSLGGRTRAELATLRPRLRPKSEQQIAEEALAADTGETADADDPLSRATEEAVAASLKPQKRPKGFSEHVKQIRQAIAAQAVAPDQQVVPDIPTSASVARAATDKNRISLRRVNLIGVYGKEDSRRALVRLANGRYQKVQVGDRLDGGQVAAIGEDELRYVKGGRPVVLKMPQG